MVCKSSFLTAIVGGTGAEQGMYSSHMYNRSPVLLRVIVLDLLYPRP